MQRDLLQTVKQWDRYANHEVRLAFEVEGEVYENRIAYNFPGEVHVSFDEIIDMHEIYAINGPPKCIFVVRKRVPADDDYEAPTYVIGVEC